MCAAFTIAYLHRTFNPISNHRRSQSTQQGAWSLLLHNVNCRRKHAIVIGLRQKIFSLSCAYQIQGRVLGFEIHHLCD